MKTASERYIERLNREGMNAPVDVETLRRKLEGDNGIPDLEIVEPSNIGRALEL
ncbi:MAG: hypothetical protein HRU11_13765, partial [Parvularculaceae bacterium]|nr:hypothetical protein [Parvularculaceae bacterium]